MILRPFKVYSGLMLVLLAGVQVFSLLRLSPHPDMASPLC